jgi:cytochrome P450
LAFPRTPVTIARNFVQKYGDVVRFRIGPYVVHLLAHPDYVKHVLHDNQKNYTKGKLVDRIKPVMGNGLVTSDGDLWRRQRRLANPSFSRQRLCSFVRLFAERTQKLLEEWEKCAARDEARDVEKEMKRLTFGILGQVLFSTEMERDAREVGDAVEVALSEMGKRAASVMPLPLWIPTPWNRRLRKAVRTLDAFVFDLIEKRKKSADRPSDLLTDFLEAVDDESNQTMTDRQLRDEMVTFVMDGYESTSLALTWTLYLLSQHAEAADKVREECNRVVGDRLPEVDDVALLVYTKMVFEEAMRLYPPVAFMARGSLAPDEIAGYRIPQNSIVLMSQCLTHRHPEFWEDPDQFNPDRFAPEATKHRHHQSFFPFGSGQRKCIGAPMSMLEAPIILCMIAQRFRLKRFSDRPLEVMEQLTLRPKGGLPMRFERV